MPEVKIFERADGTISGTRKIIHGGAGVATAPNSFDDLKAWLDTQGLEAATLKGLSWPRGVNKDTDTAIATDIVSTLAKVNDTGFFAPTATNTPTNDSHWHVTRLGLGDVALRRLYLANKASVGGDAYFGYEKVAGTITWTKIWTDANDGGGSGLDADLLDGRHGSGYLKFKGTYNSYAALIADTDGVTGETAIVDEGVGSDAVLYVWDSSDSGWVELGAGSTNVEEGTWTPVANNVSTPFSCDLILGEYTKVGNLVTVTCAIDRLSPGDSAVNPSEFIITGLPYAADATFGGGGVVHHYSGIDGAILPMSQVVGNTIEIVKQSQGSSSQTASWGGLNEISGDAEFKIIATYRI